MITMQPRLAPLDGPATLFAHWGGAAHAPANTIEAFELALRLGATGLESRAWLTSDSQIVLHHDGFVRRGLRRVPISRLERSDLPSEIPSLAELYIACGRDVRLALEVPEHPAIGPCLEVARVHGGVPRLWLCLARVEDCASVRAESSVVGLIHTTRLAEIESTIERHFADLRTIGVNGLSLRYNDWTGGLVTMGHRFQRHCWGSDAEHERMIASLIDMGVDAVSSDHVDRLVDVAAVFSSSTN